MGNRCDACVGRRRYGGQRAQPAEGVFFSKGARIIRWHREAPETSSAQLFGDVWEWTRNSYAPYPAVRRKGDR
jgi:hypothetical protein